MPERDVILNHCRKLPPVLSPLIRGRDYADYEIWEGVEGEAHFQLTREIIPPLPDFFYLSVSGRRKDVRKVINDFLKALGEPLERGLGTIPGIRMIVWNTAKIDGREN